MIARGPEIGAATSLDFPSDLENNLLSELRERSEQGENTQIVLELNEEDGNPLGGLMGSTSYGWLLIKILWVAPSVRKRGYGRDLVERAIQEAITVGCHSVWLDTSDRRALSFYLGLGFEQFGLLENSIGDQPETHCRYFLKKRISGLSGSGPRVERMG